MCSSGRSIFVDYFTLVILGSLGRGMSKAIEFDQKSMLMS